MKLTNREFKLKQIASTKAYIANLEKNIAVFKTLDQECEYVQGALLKGGDELVQCKGLLARQEALLVRFG